VAKKRSKARSKPEATYGRDELIAAASSFGATPEAMAGAVRLAGRGRLSRREAEKALKRYLERQV